MSNKYIMYLQCINYINRFLINIYQYNEGAYFNMGTYIIYIKIKSDNRLPVK